MYQLKLLFQQKVRFALTVLGVALCAMLMLFLLAIYRGVETGSIAYIRAAEADHWVMQRHAGNILRSTSLLGIGVGDQIAHIEGVRSVSPILFVMAAAQTPAGPATLYLTGYDTGSGHGGPPRIVAGAGLTTDDEIVLDRSFAAKYGLDIGDRLPINEDTLRVAGLSDGTNMFVIQYAFISLERAYAIIRFRNIATCFQVYLEEGVDADTVVADIRATVPGIAVYDRATFLENNIREMESGLLPLLFIVALISAVVLTAILSLILTVSVLERRRDYAIMKAIGSPRGFIPGMIVQQALVLAAVGLLAAIILFFPLTALVERISPEVSAEISAWHVATVAAGVTVISLLSSIIPTRKLRRIYPLEVFR